MTTTSGDYTNSGGYGTSLESIGNLMQDGSVGYTITSLSTEIYAFHHIQLKNSTVGGIPKNLGLLKVALSGTENHTLQNIYDAIVAAGYSDYVVYDGYTFILKGWIMVENTVTTAGSLVVERKNLIFVKGGVSNRSNTYIIRFGRWTSDLRGADYSMGCTIDIQNSRYPFYGHNGTFNPTGKLQVYGCSVTFGNSIKTELTETLNKDYYINVAGGSAGNADFTYDLLNFKDDILGDYIRGVLSNIKDLKMGGNNNWGNYAMIRLKIIYSSAMPYSVAPDSRGFYACNFLTYPAKLTRYSGLLHNHQGYYCNFYDCLFPGYANEMIDSSSFQYVSLDASDPTSDSFQVFNYSLTATVLDESGNVLSGVTVSAVDSLGNPAVFIQYDTTEDKLITGVKFTGSTTTDVNGQIDYYIKSYKIELNPENTTYPTSSDIIKTNYYPYTITFSKSGYRDYTVILETLNKKTDMTLTLEDYEYLPPIITSVDITNPSVSDNDGVIIINATGGTSPYQYSIDGAWQTGNTFTGLSGGTYTISVKDMQDLRDIISGIKLVAKIVYLYQFAENVDIIEENIETIIADEIQISFEEKIQMLVEEEMIRIEILNE
jgi:hypothetical protein